MAAATATTMGILGLLYKPRLAAAVIHIGGNADKYFPIFNAIGNLDQLSVHPSN